MPKAKQPLDPEIESEIVNFVINRGGDVASTEIAKGVGIDRNAIRRYLPAMIEAGKLTVRGKKRWTRYFPADAAGSGDEPQPASQPPAPPAPPEPPSAVRVEPKDLNPDELRPERYVKDHGPDVDPKGTSGKVLADHPKDPMSVLRAALPHLEGEHSIERFGKEIIAIVDNAEVHELQLRRHVSVLVRQGLIRARQVYDRGWRFYYSRAEH